MKEVLLDTDTISYFFKNNETVKIKIAEYLEEFEKLNFSIITYYEILNGLYFKDAHKQLFIFEMFVGKNKILSFDANLAKNAAIIFADLRKLGHTISHADAIIAATAIENKLTLITNNTKHFALIPNLNIENWIK